MSQEKCMEVRNNENNSERLEIITSDNCCSMCQRTFSTKGNLLRHQKSRNCGDKTKTRNIDCPLFDCNFQTRDKKTMFDHYEVYHSIKFERETLKFGNRSEFKKWKEAYEYQTKAQFVKKTSTKHTKSTSFDYYLCHRDGFFDRRGTGMKKMKLLGTNKINAHCPARIDVHCSKSDGKIEVFLIKNHVGHTLDIGRLKLSDEDKKVIAQKIASKVPFEEILNNISESVVNEELKRIHLVTKQDLWNIAESYNLKQCGEIFNKSDCLSVDAWVRQTQLSSRLVRLYKPQGSTLDEFPQLEKDDFFLVIMNEAQLEILQKFGNDVICIDETNGLNDCDIRLYSLMVLDNVQQGFPCAFLFSNRRDTIGMEVYFKVIKNCLTASNNVIYPKTFMSDMDDYFYNAWCATFEPVQHHLFCSWLVDRAWRNNLNKIKSAETRAVVYKQLKIMMFETDIDNFNTMISGFLNELSSDPDAKDFGTYFDNHYVDNCSSWAFCFRTDCKININVKLENMHKFLNNIYFEGKKVKRIDNLILQIMRFIRNKLFNRLIMIHKGQVSSKLTGLKKRHVMSQKHEDCVVVENETNWSVCSKNETHYVERFLEGCNKIKCELMCDECNDCIHSFSCTCIDFTIKWNMCKHIHIVCTWLKNNHQKNNAENTNPGIVENVTFEIEEESGILHDISETDTFSKRKDEILEKLIDVHNKIENDEQFDIFKTNIDALEAAISAPIENKDEEEKHEPQTAFSCNKEQKRIQENQIFSTSNVITTSNPPALRYFSSKKRKKTQENIIIIISNSSSEEIYNLSLEMDGLS